MMTPGGDDETVRTKTPRRRLTADEQRRRRSRVVSAALWIALGVLVVNAIVGDSGYLATIRAANAEAALASEVARLRLENQALQRTGARLEDDPLAIEEAARRLGMIREGETIVTIREASGTTPPGPAR